MGFGRFSSPRPPDIFLATLRTLLVQMVTKRKENLFGHSVVYWQIRNWGNARKCSFPPLPPLSSLTLPSPLPSLPSFLPLEVGSLNPGRRSGERCKLPQRVWDGAAAEIEIWRILVLKYDIWWQQFQ